VFERPVPPGSPIVLVVDDDAAVCLSIVQMLRRAGYDARGAASPLEADARLGTHVSALILDVHLTLMRGDVFFHYAVAQYPELRTRTIFVSGDITADVDRLVRPTGCPVLAKPFEREDLLRTLSKLLRSGSPVGGAATPRPEPPSTTRVSSPGASSGRS
jgi:CheY-like chemotaxis protein